MRYFDFHAHIVLKQVFSDIPNADSRVNGSDVKLIPHLCTDLPFIIESQTHQSQLASLNDEVIVGAVLYACESHLAEEAIKLGSLLKPGAVHKMNRQVLEDIAAGRFRSFQDFLVDRNLPLFSNSASFNILTKDSFSAPLPKDKVNIYFTIEGCHSLVNRINKIDRENGILYDPAEMLDNLDILLHQHKLPIVSINITHMQQSSLCNHAFGIQLLATDPFIPRESGLTDDGRKVIQGLFDRGICVDLKHMSYKSRLDLRNEIDAEQYNNIQPVVWTHAGFTGIPFTRYTDYIHLKRKHNSNIHYVEMAKTMQVENEPHRPWAAGFNMTTINAFDEEIVWIVQHGGIIGLCFDRRILGYVDPFDNRPTGLDLNSELYIDREYFSVQEWKALGLEGKKTGRAIGEDNCITLTDITDNTDNIGERDDFFFCHIFLQLKHYFQVCVNAGITIAAAQKHICIGADYDGFINPFINIQTVEQLPEVKKQIELRFRIYLQSLKDSKLWESQLDIPAFVEDFFYNNGFNFLKERLTRQ